MELKAYGREACQMQSTHPIHTPMLSRNSIQNWLNSSNIASIWIECVLRFMIMYLNKKNKMREQLLNWKWLFSQRMAIKWTIWTNRMNGMRTVKELTQHFNLNGTICGIKKRLKEYFQHRGSIERWHGIYYNICL